MTMPSRRMDRQEAIRLAGVGGAAVFLGGKYLGDPASAWAMNPRFDTTLTLHRGYVRATGPTAFAADEKQARIYAHVAQGDRVQSGKTGWVSGRSWVALLTGQTLRPGPADAYGVAYVENHDGTYEWYPWEVAVTLR